MHHKNSLQVERHHISLNTSEHQDVEIDLHLSGMLHVVLGCVGHVALKSLGAGASTHALQVAGLRGDGKCGTSVTK